MEVDYLAESGKRRDDQIHEAHLSSRHIIPWRRVPSRVFMDGNPLASTLFSFSFSFSLLGVCVCV